ncbi:hypothetical protein [Cerasicoccus arenae]|nr:hypothetical protein [Cerasicoccus arenae]MBK1859878.1 hypothetical protein [Cerasicoccus arenae]
MTGKRWPTLIALAGFILTVAHAGTVVLLTGEIIDGEVGLERGRITVQGAGVDRTVSDFELWHADFQPAGYAGEPGPLEAHYQENFTHAGVLMVNGSFLAGQIKEFTTEEVTVAYGEDKEKRVPLRDVSRINFTLAPVVNAIIPPGAQGVVMKNGSFVEGEFVKMVGDRIYIDSLIFGPKSFEKKQLHGLVLQDYATVSSAYIVTARNGGRLLANDIDLSGNDVKAKDPFFGEMTFKSDELASITVGSRRLRSLTDMSYIRRAPVSGDEDSLAIRTNPTTAEPLVVDPVERIVRMPAGNAMAVMADESYRGFVSRIGVPEGYPPDQQVIFQVRADRRVAFRSKPMNSSSPVQVVSVRDPIRQYVILEVLPVNENTREAPGLWIEPMMVRE